MNSQFLALRLAALVLVVVVLGLPINDLLRYGILLAAAVVVFTGSVTLDWRRWAAALFAGGVAIAGLTAWPAPRLDEGYNFYFPGPQTETVTALPADVAALLTQKFDAAYGTVKSCGCDTANCQPPALPAPRKIGYSVDGIFDHPTLSRRVTGIDFSDPVHLRLGDINDLAYNRTDGWCRGLQRFSRDRNSFNLFDRFRLLFPSYLVYQFPTEFAGSELCWRGTMLWPDGGAHLNAIDHAGMACRVLTAADIGKSLYAVSIDPQQRLAMKLKANAGVQFRRALEALLLVGGAVAVVLLLADVNLRALRLPVTLVGLSLLLTAVIDVNFIGGLRPLDDGDDGMVYEHYTRLMVQHFMHGDVAEALRGGESIYYFTPGFRYFSTLAHLVFGDTYLGYLSVMLTLPFLVLALFRRFIGNTWALILTLLFTAVPLGVLFGSSLTQYIVWAARGFADPFAFVLLFSGILLIVPKHNEEERPGAGRAFAGAAFLAMATFCRPNLVLASGILMAGACLMAMVQRQAARLVALVGGFATLAVSPLHNYYFARSTIPFSDNVNESTTLLMSPLDYLKAGSEILRLDFAGPHVIGAIRQLSGWLSGASDLPIMIPLHVAAVAVLIRVSFFGSKFNRWLRLIAFATLVQHGIGVCYVARARYSLGTWLLTVLVCAAWTQAEGLQLFDRVGPGWRSRWARSGLLRWAGASIRQIERKLGPSATV